MHFNLIEWLFTDPQTAGSNAGLSKPELFHYYIPWIVFCCLGILIAFPIIFSRAYLDGYFFAWRIWRYLWLAGLLAWAITWIVYLVRKYPKERANYIAYQNRQQYIPKSNKRKATSSR